MVVTSTTFGMNYHPEIDGTTLRDFFFAWLEGGELISSPSFDTGNTNH